MWVGFFHGDIAQRIEQGFSTSEVEGSNPSIPIIKRVDCVRVIDRLNKEQQDLLNKMSKTTKCNPPKRKHPKQDYSEEELLELMGVNRDTYKRGKGGAIKSNRR